MNIQYKDLKINYIVKDIITINDINVKVFELNITKDDHLIELGNFYSDINIEDNIGYLIDNIDDIMLNNNRYLGNNEFILSYLEEHSYNNININDIYVEYVAKDNIDIKKYSRFLELYFCNHEITDNIRKIFLEKENKKVLDYYDIDSKIKEDFNGSIGDIKLEKDHEIDIKTLNKINSKKNVLNDEINLLNEIINIINNLFKSLKTNYDINILIKKKIDELDKMSFFDKKRKNLKIEINNLESKLNANELVRIKSELNEKMKEYAISFKDSYGLNTLFKNIDLSEFLVIIKDIFKRKKSSFDKLDEESIELVNKINKYENYEIDLTDLYDRINSNKVKV